MLTGRLLQVYGALAGLTSFVQFATNGTVAYTTLHVVDKPAYVRKRAAASTEFSVMGDCLVFVGVCSLHVRPMAVHRAPPLYVHTATDTGSRAIP